MDKAAAKVKEASMAKDDQDRQARLAEALRTNLRRRKAQSREQRAEENPAPRAVPDPIASDRPL